MTGDAHEPRDALLASGPMPKPKRRRPPDLRIDATPEELVHAVLREIPPPPAGDPPAKPPPAPTDDDPS